MFNLNLALGGVDLEKGRLSKVLSQSRRYSSDVLSFPLSAFQKPPATPQPQPVPPHVLQAWLWLRMSAQPQWSKQVGSRQPCPALPPAQAREGGN